VRTTSILTPVGTLSGGNQQKVIVAREVSRNVSLLLASQPTRGLDVGSIEFVHKQIIEQRDRGAAVVIVSSELDEIYALSDRIAVMYEGKIVGFCPPDTPEEELGLMMAGAGVANGAPAGVDHQPGIDEELQQPGTVRPEPPAEEPQP
jgi:general nucleoside transport system ATP-binding protein